MNYTQAEKMMLTKYFGVSLFVDTSRLPAVFDKLADVFWLSAERKQALRDSVKRVGVPTIRDFDDYMQIMQKLVRQMQIAAEEDRIVLQCALQGFRSLHAFVRDCEPHPKSSAFQVSAAKIWFAYNVSVLFVDAFLSFEGILLPCDKVMAVRLAERSARCCQIDAVLLLLRYAEQANKDAYLSLLDHLPAEQNVQKDFAHVFDQYYLRYPVALCADADQSEPSVYPYLQTSRCQACFDASREGQAPLALLQAPPTKIDTEASPTTDEAEASPIESDMESPQESAELETATPSAEPEQDQADTAVLLDRLAKTIMETDKDDSSDDFEDEEEEDRCVWYDDNELIVTRTRKYILDNEQYTRQELIEGVKEELSSAYSDFHRRFFERVLLNLTMLDDDDLNRLRDAYRGM